MKIWLINHYAVPPKYYPLSRPYLFAKKLLNMGHDVTIIAASTIHNSDSKNIIEGRDRIKRIVEDSVPYVLINCTPYKGNGIRRVKNISEFARRLPKVLDSLEKPDVIVATSFDPLSCYEGIKYAKTHGIKAIAEIADLWPETLVEYSGISKKNPIVILLRNLEKKIYLNADSIVFTVAGGYDYIIEQGWQQIIPKEKIAYINNGIDLEQFDFNKTAFKISNPELDNDELFKVVYTGSVRRVNNLGGVLDVAKETRNPKVRFLIWGDGDELPLLKQRAKRENITNIVFYGNVDKKYIPYITSKANLNYAHNSASNLFRFGISFNKIFDYLAAGKPIICDFPSKYNPVIIGEAGVSINSANPKEIAQKIEEFADMNAERYNKFCAAARNTAKEYDFEKLALQLLNIINRKS